jgi:hypothetical protein
MQEVVCLEYLLCGVDGLRILIFPASESWRINIMILIHKCLIITIIRDAAEITPTFRKITVGSPKQLVGCGPFR